MVCILWNGLNGISSTKIRKIINIFHFTENIMWLSIDNIQEKDADSTIISDLPDVPHLVGSGKSVGGVVSETVGAGNVNENSSLQVNIFYYSHTVV